MPKGEVVVMNLKQEYVHLTEPKEKSLDTKFWAGLSRLGSAPTEVDGAILSSAVRLVLKTPYKPQLDEVIDNPQKYKVELLHKSAPGGFLQSAWRSPDRRYVMMEV